MEVAKGKDVKEAAVRGAELRMRPIFITSLTLMAGAFAILSDPIFNGMAISLLFGAGIATVMALLIIPLGCISARKQFYVETSDDGQVRVSAAFEQIEKISLEDSTKKSGRSLLGRLWGAIFSLLSWVFMIIKAMFTMVGMGLKGLFGRSGGGTPPPPRGGTPPPRETPPGGGTPPPPRQPPPEGGTPPPPSKAKGTPPPPREAPPSKVKGTPPPPREAPPSKAKGTPPPPQEAPAEKKADTPPPAPKEAPAASKPKESAAADKKGSADDENGTVGKKRRGIRLKQDLD